MGKVKAVLLGIVVAILVIYAFFNSDSVSINIIKGKVAFSAPQWAVVYASIILGWVIGFLSRSHVRKSATPKK
jgi:uncharacterized integral membrane protein